MDALTRIAQVLRAVFLKRLGVLFLLSLFYVVSGAVAGGPVTEDVWLGLAFMFAFPAAGIVGIASERIAPLSTSAGALGIPGHTASVRHVQVLVLVLVVALPIAAAIGDKHALTVAVILVGAAAFGSLLATRPYIFFIVPLVAALSRGSGDWLFNPYVQVGVLVIALYVLARWLRLPSDAEAEGAAGVHGAWLAELEASQPNETESNVEGGDGDLRELDYDMPSEETVEHHSWREGVPMTARDLGFALGFDASVDVKAGLFWGVIASGIVLVWHFLHGRQPLAGAYWVLLAIAAMAVAMRANSLYEAWCRSVGEQSLMRLAPRGLERAHTKRLLARAVGAGLPVTWFAWATMTVLALTVGSIDAAAAATAAAIMLATSLAAVANLLMLFSRTTLKPWHAATFLFAVPPGVGALLVALRELGAPALLGVVLMVVPAIVAAVVFARCRLTLPANVVR